MQIDSYFRKASDCQIFLYVRVYVEISPTKLGLYFVQVIREVQKTMASGQTQSLLLEGNKWEILQHLEWMNGGLSFITRQIYPDDKFNLEVIWQFRTNLDSVIGAIRLVDEGNNTRIIFISKPSPFKDNPEKFENFFQRVKNYFEGTILTETKFDGSNLVFVIIAFRDHMESVFESIKAAGTAVGLDVKRVKDIPGDYRITDQIIQMINSAKFVVADLTHERPNVYFELGYARGIRKTVITTAREYTDIHFDVKDWTCLFYTDSRVLEGDIKKRFEYELSKL